MPNSPNQARVEVVGEHSVHIWWLQPEADSGGICTKFKGELDKRDKHGSASAFLLNVEYVFSLTGSLSLSTIFTVMLFFFFLVFFLLFQKVQWSTHPDFAFPGGELEVRDTQIWKRGGVGDEFNEVNVTVSTCPSNSRCYFRVAAGNLSGYGSFKTTLPSSVLLSGGGLAAQAQQSKLVASESKHRNQISNVIFSFHHLLVWRIIDGRKPRFAGRLPILDDLFSKVRETGNK